MSALTLVKVLRPILPGSRLQQHLTDCAAYEVLIRAFKPYLPPLRFGQVFGLAVHLIPHLLAVRRLYALALLAETQSASRLELRL